MTTADIKTAVLLAALPDVPFDGWTEPLLARAAKKAKVSPEKIKTAFPKGMRSLVVFFSAWATAEMEKNLQKKDIENLRVRERITLGVRTRLEILTPHKQAVSASLSFLSLPPRNLHLPKMLWDIADKIWWCAGDAATDYNHYTKRMLLSGVISATTLYWLNDTSDNHKNTWEFLDRRIEDALKIGKKFSALKKRSAS